jgi:para-nitrobenzyl esterase
VNLTSSPGAPVRDDAGASIVRTDSGRVAGRRDVGGVSAFLGVPFAAAPVGALRFRPPAPVAPWTGVRPAHAFAPQCPQPARPADSVYAEYAGLQPMSEDCLYLNVWSATPDPNARWPVLVWFHGGAFQQGAGSNPVFVRGDLPCHGVVLVTFNYRLGPFGFLAHPELAAESAEGTSGNVGLLDMAAALEWVHRNIAAFGGDPRRVTIFGQSAGAAGVVAMMAAERTRGLFARAAAQSFGFSHLPSRADAELAGAALAARLGAPSLRELRELDGATLMARFAAQPERCMPIIDGALLACSPQSTFAAGAQAPVPFLTGWNRDEGSTFPAATSAEHLRARLKARFGARAADAERLYPAGDDAEARTSSLALFGDDLFAWGCREAARNHARIAPTFVYHFAQPQPFRADQSFREAEHAAGLGVFHSAEYPYLFGSTATLTRAWGDADRKMTTLMQDLWLAFARTGDPNRDGLPRWPTYDDAAPTILQLDASPSLVALPRRAELDFVGVDRRGAP